MFLDFTFSSDKMLLKKKKIKSLDEVYNFWLENLFERIMRLFKYNNIDSVLPKEIEQRLLINGHCAIALYENKLTAFYGEFSTPTIYFDEFEKYSVFSPIYAKTLEIGKDCIIIENNALKNPCIELCEHYATLLAHLDISLINALVNMRDSNGIPVASTQKELEVLRNYRKKLYSGEVVPILDSAFSMTKFVQTGDSNKTDIKAFIETRKNLLDCFYNDIGVKTSYDKKGNMIREEVDANDNMLLFNIQDMLDSRKKCIEKVNEFFSTNIQIELAEGVYINESARNMEQ